MKITILVAQLDNGGGVRVLAQYADGLRKLGHDVLIVSPTRRPTGRLNKIKNYVLPFKGSVPSNHFMRLGVPVKLLERHRPIRYSDIPDADIIIATWWETANWMADFPAAKGKKLHFVQDYEVWNGRKDEVDETLRLPIPKIVISSWIASKLNEIGVSTPDVISNGVDQDLFYSDKRSPPRKPVIGFVYTGNPRKGGDIAFEAIRCATKERMNINALVFGHSAPAHVPNNLENLTFIVSPDQAELRRIYSSCTAWLFPSREEGFGLPILEAMACGTPVIACPSGAAPEILEKGGGTLLNSFEPEEMSDEIIKYVDMAHNDWLKLSASAGSTAKNFGWSHSVAKFEHKLMNMIKAVG